MLNVTGGGSVQVDSVVDASVWGLFYFGACEAKDPRIQATMKSARDNLWRGSGACPLRAVSGAVLSCPPLSASPPLLSIRLVVLVELLLSLVPATAAAGAAETFLRLRGRVYARGSVTRIADAEVAVTAGAATYQRKTDAQGRFELEVPSPAAPGGAAKLLVDVLVRAVGYETLHEKTSLKAGPGVTSAEYLLRPLPAFRLPFSAVVRGDPRNQGEHTTLRGEELTTLPGSLGDPFRALGLLPGVATPIPLLPVFVVRGDSPGMNGFFLDGMRVPQLFHLLVGGGVIHARLVEQLDFYPGAYDASFGRYAGGIIDAHTRPARGDGYHGELEVRLYDASAAVEMALPHDVRLTLSGHYGYPGPIVHAIDNDVSLSYWDYQLRLDWKGLTVQALGSFDEATIADLSLTQRANMPVANTFRQTFHRVQVRDIVHRGRFELETGIVGGYDEMVIFQGYGVSKLSLNLRAIAAWSFPWLKIRLGAEGELSRFEGQNFDTDPVHAHPDDLGELAGARDGIVSGAFVVASVGPLRSVQVTVSARADVYHANGVTLVGIDPRFQVRATLTDWLTLHVGYGYYQQPPSFPVPLPGIDTFALQLGLQRALHGAVGEELKLPASFTFSATGFYQRYYNSNDVVLDFTPMLCTSPPPESLTGYIAQVMRQVDGYSYGMETMLRRHSGRVTGWIAYTLSRAERIFTCGLRPADYDQTHVLNVVVQVRLPWNLMAGARFFYSTGRPVTELQPPDGSATIRNNTRLPDTIELDLRLDREWLFRRFAIDAFLEVVNATYGMAVFGLTYPVDGNVTRYDEPMLNGFNWILPSIGVRGRF